MAAKSTENGVVWLLHFLVNLHINKIHGKKFSSYQLTFEKRFITECAKILLQKVAKMCYKTRQFFYDKWGR